MAKSHSGGSCFTLAATEPQGRRGRGGVRVLAGLALAAALLAAPIGPVQAATESVAASTPAAAAITLPAAPQAAATAPSRPAAAPASAASGSAKVMLRLRWERVPRVIGRVDARSLGVVINEDDPYSVEVGEYYAARRQIPPEHVLRLRLPRHPRLSAGEAAQLRDTIERHFGADVQGLALVWTQPWAAECQSITSAVSLGLDADLCAHTCGKPAASRYFNSPSGAPWRDHSLRPSMLLAAGSVEAAKALVDRGLAADGSLGLRGALPVHAYYMVTNDVRRSVRAPLFPPPGVLRGVAVTTHVVPGDLPAGDDPLLLLQTGAPVLGGLERLNWVPGALADHLTSYGGQLSGHSGQTSALAWIDAGATASFGTVSEPCNHIQKFPRPQTLLLHYLQGASALEAYWKSVRWPQQGLFIGEPLAAPFARH